MEPDPSKHFQPEGHSGRSTLFAGGVAAILASACCLGPLVLISLGFSGAWIASLTLLEPYRPVFIGIALLALLFAWRQLWRPAVACAPGAICGVSQVKRVYKLLFGGVSALVLVALAFPYLAPLFY